MRSALIKFTILALILLILGFWLKSDILCFGGGMLAGSSAFHWGLYFYDNYQWKKRWKKQL